jgi:probable HAF family extracellular repeat protein
MHLLSPFGRYVPFVVAGINNWGSIVATYQQTGFKLWSNGDVVTLNYPGAYETAPSAINDSGMIVGFYEVSGQLPGGFIYSNGQWATLNYPNSTNTLLVGISNAGRIIGWTANANGFTTAFIYENGAFKIISVPNAIARSTRLLSITLRSGLILGTANFSTGIKAFVATCQ